MLSTNQTEFRALHQKTQQKEETEKKLVEDSCDWEEDWEEDLDEEIAQPGAAAEPTSRQWESEEGGEEGPILEDWEMDMFSGEDKIVPQPVAVAAAAAEPTSSHKWDSDEESDVEQEVVAEDPGTTTVSSTPVKQQEVNAPTKQKKKKKKQQRSRRAPVAVVLGHVDSGKTLLLDCIRGTKVQAREAGGITQQIGATNLPISHILSRAPKCLAKEYKELLSTDCPLPGLLVIDTPGHAVFANLRERGSSLCDTAVLVINIMEGFQITTSQCLEMLLEKKVPFVIALNQVDRLNGWKPHPKLSIQQSLKKQSKRTRQHFQEQWRHVFCQFAEAEINVALPWEGNPKTHVMVVPTSARTNCGVPDLLLLWTQLCTRKKLAKKLMVSDKFKCKLLEVKKVKGHGHVVDVLVTSGSLAKGDTLAFCGMQGTPVVSKVRALLVPRSVQDLRAKAAYDHVSEVHASCGVRVACVDSLEHAVAGSRVFKVDSQHKTWKDLTEKQISKVQEGLKAISNVTRSSEGVFLVASTLGSLEALVELLGSMNVPISGFSLGRVRKHDVMRACAMLHSAPDYAVLIAFDVEVDRRAQDLAEAEGLKLLHSDLYHHLETAVEGHFDGIREGRREQYRAEFGLPVRLLANECFSKRRGRGNNKKFLFAVDVELGTLETGMHLFRREPLNLDHVHLVLRRMFRCCKEKFNDSGVPFNVSSPGTSSGVPFNVTKSVCEFVADTNLIITPVGKVTGIMDTNKTAVDTAPVHSRVSVCLQPAPEALRLDLEPSTLNPFHLYTKRLTFREFQLLRELFPEFLAKSGKRNTKKRDNDNGKKKPKKR